MSQKTNEARPGAVLRKTDPGYEAHMTAVRTRVEEQMQPQGQERLQRKTQQISERIMPGSSEKLLWQVMQAKSNAKRLFWMRQEADMTSKAAAPFSACRKGCSDCCNINVLISEPEARAIAKEVGLKLGAPAPEDVFSGKKYLASNDEDKALLSQEWPRTDRMGDPCPFLSGGACGIYEHRPMACRLQINLDDDALLCRLVEDDQTPVVPYLDQRIKQGVYVLAWGLNARMADIRDWFPGRPLEERS